MAIAGGLLALAILCLAGWSWAPDRAWALLERKYLRTASDRMQLAGMQLHVRDTGAAGAPAVILLHGFGSSLDTWEPWALKLATRYRVIRFDLPGCGLSEPDPTGDYRDTRTLEIMNRLMDGLGVAHASLIGNSLGGRIAWKFAAVYPQRVDKLVLISPDGFASPGFQYGVPPKVPAILKLMKYFLPKPLLRMNLAPAYGDPAHLTAAAVDRYYDLLLAPGGRGAMLERMRQTVLEDPVPLLRRIDAPTLLLWGEKDRLIPFYNAADYQKALAHVQLVSFPELGHVPHEEAPAESIGPVERFLAQ